MLQRLRILGLCLLLAMLLAPSAQAIAIPLHPGAVELPASPLSLSSGSASGMADLMFSNMKTFEFGPGILAFSIQPSEPVPYTGFLRDALGNEIPGTASTRVAEFLSFILSGSTPSGSATGQELHATSAGALPSAPYVVLWSGSGPGSAIIPEPRTAILLSLSLVGLSLSRRRSR
jgi:hypothetical protein